MNQLINKDNYEAFYLDYLEGNLNEVDTCALLLFLKQHPELVLDDDFMPTLDPVHIEIDPAVKQLLHCFDAHEDFRPELVELWMIASIENLLSPKQNKQLNAFLALNTNLQEDFKYYALTKLQADSSIVFTNKYRLKQSLIIPLFGKITAVAASMVGIILVANLINQNEPLIESNSYLSAHFLPSKIDRENQVSIDQSDQIIPTIHINRPSQQIIIAQQIFNLKLKDIKKIDYDKDSEIIPLSFAVTTTNKTTVAETIAAQTSFLSFSDMKNPIKPITEAIKNRFDRDVDFRSAKASKNKQGGFYLKIGRLEIARKSAPKQDDLANN